MTDWVQKAAEEIVRSEDLGEGSVRDIAAIIQRHAPAPIPTPETCNGFHAADCGHTVACDTYGPPATPETDKA